MHAKPRSFNGKASFIWMLFVPYQSRPWIAGVKLKKIKIHLVLYAQSKLKERVAENGVSREENDQKGVERNMEKFIHNINSYTHLTGCIKYSRFFLLVKHERSEVEKGEKKRKRAEMWSLKFNEVWLRYLGILNGRCLFLDEKCVEISHF